MSQPATRTSAAWTDLAEIAVYLGERTPGTELRFLDAAEQTIDRLAASPELGAVYPTQLPRLQGIRVWRVQDFEKYLIFYRPTESGIEVIRVLHGARDLTAIFGDS